MGHAVKLGKTRGRRPGRRVGVLVRTIQLDLDAKVARSLDLQARLRGMSLRRFLQQIGCPYLSKIAKTKAFRHKAV